MAKYARLSLCSDVICMLSGNVAAVKESTHDQTYGPVEDSRCLQWVLSNHAMQAAGIGVEKVCSVLECLFVGAIERNMAVDDIVVLQYRQCQR